jgi:hypothetical protein
MLLIFPVGHAHRGQGEHEHGGSGPGDDPAHIAPPAHLMRIASFLIHSDASSRADGEIPTFLPMIPNISFHVKYAYNFYSKIIKNVKKSA